MTKSSWSSHSTHALNLRRGCDCVESRTRSWSPRAHPFRDGYRSVRQRERLVVTGLVVARAFRIRQRLLLAGVQSRIARDHRFADMHRDFAGILVLAIGRAGEPLRGGAAG